MAVQINGIDVIYGLGASTILCTGNQLTANSYGPNVHADHTDVSASGTTSILLNRSQTFLTLTGNLTISISAVLSKGNTSEIILDTGGYTPTFNASHFFWSAGTEPTWADHQYWRITCVGLSSTTCVASATGYSLPGTTIPISGTSVTRTGQEASSGLDVGFVGDLAYLGDPAGSVTSRAELDVRFSREPIGGNPGFQIQIRRATGLYGTWYDSLGGSATLTGTYVTIYQNTTATPSAVRMTWTKSTQGINAYTSVTESGGYNEGDWSSTATNGSGITVGFDAEANADPFSSLNAVQANYTIEFWGRSAGFDDTLLVSYNISLDAEAEIDSGQ